MAKQKVASKAKQKQQPAQQPHAAGAAPDAAASQQHAALLKALAVSQFKELVGRKVEVPNSAWEGFSDSGITLGAIAKVGRQSGEDVAQVKFAPQNGWSTPPIWLQLEKIAGIASVGTCGLTCRLLKPEVAQRKASAAAGSSAGGGAVQGSARGKRKAPTQAPPTDKDEEDLEELPMEWTEGFAHATPMPVHANARGGLKVRLPADPKALDFHKLTCPDEVYELVLKQTLRQAEARNFDWSKTDPGKKAGPNGEPTLPELKVFFAITMLMSIVKLTVLREYWEKGWCGHDMVKECFTLERFEAILANLHFADPNDRPEPMEEGSERLRPEDRNWKMDEVQKLFTNAWCRAGAYTQFLAHDESMLKYRGRKDARKQRLPQKPIKMGLKAFVLAGALGPLRGYVYDLSIYGGAGDGGDNEEGAKVDYVTRLLDPELDGKGGSLVVLNERGIGFVGTFNAGMTSFSGFERPEIGTYQSGTKAGQPRYGPVVEHGKFRSASAPLATIAEENGAGPSTPAKRVGDRLYISTWSDSSKTNPVSFLSNFCEKEAATCMRQPKVATEANPECVKEERECPWIATVYGPYYGGVDTVDMDVNQSRFDHKSSVPWRSRSYHRVWWALHGWGITNGWRLRRVHEAQEAEVNDWYHYPNGRVYYTRLRQHMKEVVNEQIAEARREGFESTRCKPGPKHVPGSTLLDPLVLEHEPEYITGVKQRCQREGCNYLTSWRCPGCAGLDSGCGPAAGFYCREPTRNCIAANHRKRVRTKAPAAANAEEEDDE